MIKRNRIIVSSPNWEGGVFENVDIMVDDQHSKYYGVVITMDGLKKMIDSYKNSGECLHGKYVAINSMIILESVSKDFVQKVVEDIYYTSDLGIYFET